MAHSVLQNTEAFDTAVGGTPVLVKFTAEWCGPCKTVAPVVAEVADDLDGRMDVLEVDIDAHPSVKNRYNIHAVPTFILFEDGEPLATIGASSKRGFLASIEPLL